MAEDDSIELNLNTNIPEQSANSITSVVGLKKAYKDAMNEMAAGTKGAAQRAADLKDRLEDLKEETKSLKGSGVEKLSSSMNILQEGFLNADPEKLGVAMKGLGTAMSAIPILLLIEGLKYLWDNLDKVTRFLNGSTTAMEEAQKAYDATAIASGNLSKALQREIDLLDAQGASEDKILAKKKEKLQADLQVAEASLKLNKAKLADIEANDSLYESYLRLQIRIERFLGQTKAAEINEKLLAENKRERSADLIKATNDAEQAILDIKNQTAVAIAKADTKSHTDAVKTNKEALQKQTDDLKEFLKIVTDTYEKYAALRKSDDDKKKAEQDKIDLSETAASDRAIAKEKAYRDAVLELRKNYNEKSFEGKLTNLQNEQDKELASFEWTEEQKSVIKQKYADKANQIEKEKRDAEVSIAKEGLVGLQIISDLFFDFKMSKYKKGTKEEEAVARKQFELNKKFQIAQTSVQGVQNGIIAYGAGLKAASATGIGAIGAPLMGAAFAAISALGTIGAIHRIDATPFGGSSAPAEISANVPSMPQGNSSASSVPSFSLFGNQSTGNGIANNLSNQGSAGSPSVIKAYVVSQEITDQQTANNYSLNMGQL